MSSNHPDIPVVKSFLLGHTLDLVTLMIVTTIPINEFAMWNIFYYLVFLIVSQAH